MPHEGEGGAIGGRGGGGVQWAAGNIFQKRKT